MCALFSCLEKSARCAGRGFFVWSNGRPLPEQRVPAGLYPGEEQRQPGAGGLFPEKPPGLVRVGITTSKKIGNAVQRNRSRRVIREAFRQLAPQVRPGVDLVFVARGKTPHVKSTEVRRHMERLLSGAGLLLPAAGGEGERER